MKHKKGAGDLYHQPLGRALGGKQECLLETPYSLADVVAAQAQIVEFTVIEGRKFFFSTAESFFLGNVLAERRKDVLHGGYLSYVTCWLLGGDALYRC